MRNRLSLFVFAIILVASAAAFVAEFGRASVPFCRDPARVRNCRH